MGVRTWAGPALADDQGTLCEVGDRGHPEPVAGALEGAAAADAPAGRHGNNLLRAGPHRCGIQRRTFQDLPEFQPRPAESSGLEGGMAPPRRRGPGCRVQHHPARGRWAGNLDPWPRDPRCDGRGPGRGWQPTRVPAESLLYWGQRRDAGRQHPQIRTGQVHPGRLPSVRQLHGTGCRRDGDGHPAQNYHLDRGRHRHREDHPLRIPPVGDSAPRIHPHHRRHP